MLEQIDKDIFIFCQPEMQCWPIVLDIGAHKGAYSDFVESVCERSLIYAFEPNTDLFHKIDRQLVYNVAVSNVDGMIPIYICNGNDDELSSIYNREVFEGIEVNKIMIESITIDTFLKQNKLDYLDHVDFVKIDVEGAELDVLLGAENSMKFKYIKFLQVEYGGTYLDSGIKFTDVIKFVNSVGYKVFEKADVWIEVTIDNFIEDYRYQNFLLTY